MTFAADWAGNIEIESTGLFTVAKVSGLSGQATVNRSEVML